MELRERKERNNLASPTFHSPIISSHWSNLASSRWECSLQGSALRDIEINGTISESQQANDLYSHASFTGVIGVVIPL